MLVVLALALGAMLAPISSAGAAPPEPRWTWPLDPPHRLVRAFEAPAHAYGPGHRGVDLSGGGTRVLAVEGGVVRFAGQVAGRGVVSVTHADGLISTYEPVTASVAIGDAVGAGHVLGELSATGSHCTGGAPCLHLGARRGETYLDPMLLLGMRGPSVLLPLAGGAGTGGGRTAGDRLPAGGERGGVAPGGEIAPVAQDEPAAVVRAAVRASETAARGATGTAPSTAP